MRKKNHLKVGFIGTGAISSIIAKEIESGKLGNIEIVAVFDTNLSFANILVNQLNSNPYIYSSIENLVNNEQIDLIIECASQTAVEKNAELVLKANKDITYENLSHNDKVSKISIVGAGMVSTPGITYRMFRSLAEEKINILAISTSEIKLSVIINEDDTLKGVKKLHTVFDLD